MKKRKGKPHGLGQATTMNADELSPNVRIDGPHQASEEDELPETPDLPDSPSSLPDLADSAPLQADDLASLSLEPVVHPPKEVQPDSHTNVSVAPPASDAADHPPPAHQDVPNKEPPALDPPLAQVSPPEAILLPLEERIRKLEAALTDMQDPQKLASSVAARVSDQIARELAPAAGTGPTAGLVEIGKRLFNSLKPPAAPPPAPPVPRPPGKRSSWLPLEIVAEARAILRMYVDPRYSMSWTGRFVPIVVLIFYVMAESFVSIIPLLGPLLVKIPFLVKVIELPIAFVLFKVLSQEARRIRETSPDLPPSLRL